MRLIVDTSVLVGELMRSRGRKSFANQLLDLYLPDILLTEAELVLPRRIEAFSRSRHLRKSEEAQIRKTCFETLDKHVTILEKSVYTLFENEARARSLRDPTDWPAVAAALAMTAGIWTNDNDFLGTGVPTWTTETLKTWLERHAQQIP